AAAVKYFGQQDPMNQVLTLGKDITVKVTGILKNIPRTSSLRFNVLVSMGTARNLGMDLDDWSQNTQVSFLLLEDGLGRSQAERGLTSIFNKYIQDPDIKPKRAYLFPFLDFRLKGEHIQTTVATSSPLGVFIGLFFGILLILVVSINFINLSTARYMHRLKEIGLRKVIGARRSQLVKQFLGESLLLSLIALPVAIIIYEMIHPLLSSYLGDFALLDNTVQVSNSILNYPFLLKYMLIAAALTGLFSGLYPALFLSAFHPSLALKGSLKAGRKKRRGSKFMIIFQFALSILFIVLAGILRDQYGEFVRADLGFNRKQVAAVQLPSETRLQRETIKTELLRNPQVESVTAAGAIPLVWAAMENVKPAGAGDEEIIRMEAYGVDTDFVQTLGIDLMKGRTFKDGGGDRLNYVINQSAAKKLPWKDPIGEKITIAGRTGVVIGITENFLFDDIAFSIPPAVLYLEPDNLNVLLVKYTPNSTYRSIEKIIHSSWMQIVPNALFQCTDIDAYFLNTFGLINRVGGFLNMIGIAAVFLSCMGLLGLVSFMLERRLKEIGIRKILGASMTRILWNLGREYIQLVVIANVISLGLVFYGWSRALKTGLMFITPIGIEVYLTALGLSVLSAGIAIGSRTLKAARSNPVDSLKYE
ncbi:FtsX-like permease family protein, partial [Acidobacteriota bacterium]